jgi:hypothetical protein
LCPVDQDLKDELVLVPGSVKYERIFYLMKLIKSLLRNSLINPHLSEAILVSASGLYTVSDFPYDEAVDVWKNSKKRRITERERCRLRFH